MTKLSVNLNKIAWLRNARDGVLPNLVEMTEVTYLHLTTIGEFGEIFLPNQ